MPPRESVDLLIESRWMLPIAPASRVLRGHSIAVRDGKIAALGPAAQLLEQFEPRERIARDSHVLLPGFVNGHTHAAMTLLRGQPANRPLMPWLCETIWPAEQRWVSADFVRDGTRLAVAEMLLAGVTAFGDMYLFPEEAARVATEARVRAVIGLPVTEAATAWADDANGYLAKAERVWDEYHDSPWVNLRFAPQAPYSVADSTLQRVRRVADELDARIVMHVHECESEAADSLARYGKRPLQRLDDLGLLRPGFTAVHMNHLDGEDLDRVARRGIAVVSCPQFNSRLGNGRCATRELVSREVAVGLGTGSAAGVGALDMLAETRASALLEPGESAEEALHLATLGGAATLGLTSDIGSLEVGKSADFLCIDLDTLASQPDSAVAQSVVFGATRQQISDVWVAGRAMVAGGRLLAFDEQELLALAKSWSARIYGAQS